MRNGNVGNGWSVKDALGSYRTYEEWKLSFMKNVFPPTRVLTVPMRNGNKYTYLYFSPM